MNITRTDFICVPTQDYEKSSKFYGETLGLPFSKQWGSMPAGEYETGSLTLALGVLLLLAGSTIAPTFATAYAMVDLLAPRGTATEAFAWLATASAVGLSLGAAGAGGVVDLSGPAAAFAFGGLAAAIAATVAVLRARTLPGTPIPQGATT